MKLLLSFSILISLTVGALAQETSVAASQDSIRVVVHFTVEKSGEITNFKVVKMNCDCSKERRDSIAIKVKEIIMKNPIPPKKDKRGRPISANYFQPIVFIIEDE